MAQRQNQPNQADQNSETNTEEQLHGYRFIRTLGKGNFGKVKLAVHILTGEYVAIKILQKDLIFEKADIQRISRQIKIMKQVRHPYIIQLYEIIQNSKRLYLIMEYGEGGDLFDLIVKYQKLQENAAARIFGQIVLGLQYLHSKGITHRDMKPQNILLSRDNTIKIADFGLGNFFKEGETLKTACGSPCYASPQMLNRSPYNPQTIDVWSTGIILYAMVCGYLPFEDQNTSRLYEKIKSTNPRFPKALSEDLKDFLRQILDKNPENRIKLKEMKETAWLKDEFKEEHNTTFIADQRKIKYICKSYGIDDEEKLTNYLKKNKHNNFTTIYYLASKKSDLEEISEEDGNEQEKMEEEFYEEDEDEIERSKKKIEIEGEQMKCQKQIEKNVEESEKEESEVQKENNSQEESKQQQNHLSNSSNFTHQISFSHLNGLPQQKQDHIQKQNQQEDQKQKQQVELAVQKIQQPQNIQLEQHKSSDEIQDIKQEKQSVPQVIEIGEPKKQKKDEMDLQNQVNRGREKSLEVAEKLIKNKQEEIKMNLKKKQEKIVEKEDKKTDSQQKQQMKMVKQKNQEIPSPQNLSKIENKKYLQIHDKGHRKANQPQKQFNTNRISQNPKPSYHQTPKNQNNADTSLPKNKLKKNSRMPIQKHTISRKDKQSTYNREKPINEKSHSKDTKASQVSSRKLIGKSIIQEPHLVDPEKIVFCSWFRLMSLASELGVEGKIEYLIYDKECIYISRCNVKGIRNLHQIINKINVGVTH